MKYTKTIEKPVAETVSLLEAGARRNDGSDNHHLHCAGALQPAEGENAEKRMEDASKIMAKTTISKKTTLKLKYTSATRTAIAFCCFLFVDSRV